MRIAIIPNPTFKDLEGESEFLMVRQMARDVVKRRPDVYFYIVIPSWCHPPETEDGIAYLTDDSDQKLAFHDRIATVPMKFAEWFNARHGVFPVDAVFTTRTAAAPMMCKYLRDFRDKARIPVFIDESIAMDMTLSEYFSGHEDLIARSLGYYLAAHSFMDTTFEKDRAVKAARRHITATHVKDMLDRMSVIPCGVSVDRVDRLTRKVRRSFKFQVMCGNRLNASKRPEKMLELYNQFYAFGRNVRVVITTPETGAFVDKIKDRAHLELYKSFDSDSFVKKCAQSHVVVETTRFGGFSIGLSEMILAGPVVILPKLKWIRSIVGELWDEYPFFYKNFAEAAAVLRYVHDNFEKADKQMEPMRKFWRENYDSINMNMKMFEVIERCVEETPDSSLWSKGNVELILDGLKDLSATGIQTASLKRLFAAMIEKSRAMKPKDFEHPLRGVLSKWSIYRWLCKNGWKDTAKYQVPVFVEDKDGKA